ncbi:MAG: YbjN domain-containing protein [Parachlamydiaceae bacterium]
MILLQLSRIKQHLYTKGMESEIQEDSNQLCILFKIGERDFPLFLRIYEGSELLQIVAFLPCHTTAETLNDTARLLHLLNKETDTPGFGMDETSSVVFFRIMIPGKEKKVDEQVLDAYLHATQVICNSFAPVIAAVAYGSITYDALMQQTKEQGSSSLTQSQMKPL